jgi:hypothetical protein
MMKDEPPAFEGTSKMSECVNTARFLPPAFEGTGEPGVENTGAILESIHEKGVLTNPAISSKIVT